MSKMLILPEDTDPEEIGGLLEHIRNFAKCVEHPEWDDNIGYVTGLTDEIVDEYAEGFEEFRKIGTDGLQSRYVGRYSIAIYGDIPYYIFDMVHNLTKSTVVEIKEKERSGW